MILRWSSFETALSGTAKHSQCSTACGGAVAATPRCLPLNPRMRPFIGTSINFDGAASHSHKGLCSHLLHRALSRIAFRQLINADEESRPPSRSPLARRRAEAPLWAASTPKTSQANGLTLKESTSTPAFLTLMYVSSPFFFNPLKLPLQLAFGSEYSRAYRHFRNNHSDPMNIVVHLVGLVHLCFANFALLHAVDEALFGERFPMFAAVTAIGWSYLLTARATRAPWSVRACACAVICGAFAARRLWHPRVFTTVAFIEAPFHALIWRFGDGKALPTTQPLLLWLLVVALIAAPVQ